MFIYSRVYVTTNFRDEFVNRLDRRIAEKDLLIAEKDKELLALRKEYNDKIASLRSKEETHQEKDKIINEKEMELLAVRYESSRAVERLRAEMEELRRQLNDTTTQVS